MLRKFYYPLFLIAFPCLIAFGLLQLHNHEQTEYLIFWDFWRNFSALKDGQLYPFIYHNVHTYLIDSAIWYLDVVFANGSLKLVHAYVVGATLLSMYCLYQLTRNQHRRIGLPSSYSIFIVLVVFALWLSPSNASSFSRPLVDIFASTIFMLLNLIAIIGLREPQPTKFLSTRQWTTKLSYIGIVFIGFFTLETFIVVPLILAFDSWVRGDRKESISHIILSIFIGALYLLTIQELSTSPASNKVDRSLGVMIHNFLLLLSSHYELLFSALKITSAVAIPLSECISILQLICMLIFLWHHYAKSGDIDLAFRLPLLLSVFGILSIALAVWLRGGSMQFSHGVPRYTPYSMSFSIGVFLLASTQLNKIRKFSIFVAGTSIMALNITYLIAEGGAMWHYSFNVASKYTWARMEMPIFALSPGQELNIGPSEPSGGYAYRASLHDFLKRHEYSVFSSDGYRSIGMQLSPVDLIHNKLCVRRKEESVIRGDTTYSLITFEGADGEGVFLVADSTGRVVNFSFPVQLTQFSHSSQALFPEDLARNFTVYFVHFRDGKLADALTCN